MRENNGEMSDGKGTKGKKESDEKKSQNIQRREAGRN
jgi:hypothetical protein